MDQSVEEAFAANWGRRRLSPIVTESWVNNDWARGRINYLTFLIKVDDPTVHEGVRSLQEVLSRNKCIDPFPPQYLHVTVKETSCFLVKENPATDELTQEQLDKIVDLTRNALRDIDPFTIEFMRINHFRSNIVIESHDDGSVREMNKRLLEIKGVRKLQYDYPKFLPHMSIAQFKCDEDHDTLVNHLEELRETKIGSFNVNSIQLVKAILPKTGRYPLLEPLKNFRLGQTRGASASA